MFIERKDDDKFIIDILDDLKEKRRLFNKNGILNIDNMYHDIFLGLNEKDAYYGTDVYDDDDEYSDRLKAVDNLKKIGIIKKYYIETKITGDGMYVEDFVYCLVDWSKISEQNNIEIDREDLSNIKEIQFINMKLVFEFKNDAFLKVSISSGRKTQQSILLKLLFQNKNGITGADFDEELEKQSMKINKTALGNAVNDINMKILNSDLKIKRFIVGGRNNAEINDVYKKFISY